MIDNEASFLAAEHSKDNAVADIVSRDLIDQVLLVVKPDVAVLERNQDVICGDGPTDSQSCHGADFRRHGHRKALLAFQVVGLNDVVHACYHDLFVKSQKSDWL